MTDYRLRAEGGAFAVMVKAIALESRTVRWLKKYRWLYVTLWALATMVGLAWTWARGELVDFAFAVAIVAATYLTGRLMESTERETTVDRR